MTAHILVTQKIPEMAYPLLNAAGTVDANMEQGLIWSPAELLQRAPGHEYLLCLVTDTIDARLLEACAPHLKLVANMAVGYNNIDVAAAQRLGILVTNTPGVLTDTTADLAFGLLLATARRISEAERYMRARLFTGWEPLLLCGTDVHGATLGIVGAGRIGMAMARRAQGFDMNVMYYNRHRLPFEEEEPYRLTYASLDALLEQSDFVSLHTPYSKETYHLIDEHKLSLMKPTAMLINTARGPVVDEKALVKALQQGIIAGAGLDVFEQEPAVEPELLAMENVVLLPHIASASIKTRTRMAVMASENIIAHVKGQPPPHVISV